VSGLETLRSQVPGADLAVRAPGRANLIGEHTDYNAGFVFPLAIDLETTLLARRTDGVVRLRSEDAEGVIEVDLSTGRGPDDGWGRYVTAVVQQLLEAGLPVRGLDGALSSTVPSGAGLSSSAALEVAVALAVLDSAALREPMRPEDIAKLCQRAENIGVGVASGLMDQLASACGVEGSALLLDCRSVTFEAVPLPAGVAVVLVDSAVPHSLVDSEYGERRKSCEAAAASLDVEFLRDVDERALTAAEDSLDPLVFRRARHVVTENDRVLLAAAALHRGDLVHLGALFAASHASMSADFEITTPEVDQLVELAVATPGVHASRMTGGGFGGCVVSLVDAERAPEIAEQVRSTYAEASGLPARAWVCTAAAGAQVLPL
jgi:galactokinase